MSNPMENAYKTDPTSTFLAPVRIPYYYTDNQTSDQRQIVVKRCICLEYIHDNGNCPVHGPAPKPQTHGPEWTEQAFQAGEELGTRAIVSGGEVIELDGHLEARYEEQTDIDLPF